MASGGAFNRLRRGRNFLYGGEPAKRFISSLRKLTSAICGGAKRSLNFFLCAFGVKENPHTAGNVTPNESNFNPNYIRCRSRGNGQAVAEPASRWRVAGRGVRSRYTFMAAQIPFF